MTKTPSTKQWEWWAASKSSPTLPGVANKTPPIYALDKSLPWILKKKVRNTSKQW